MRRDPTQELKVEEMVKRTTVILFALALVTTMAVPIGAVEGVDRGETRTNGPSAEQLSSPVTSAGTTLGLDSSLRGSSGEQTVIVRLAADSLAEKGDLSETQAARAVRDIGRSQDELISRIKNIDPNSRVIAQVQRVLNAVFIEVDASALDAIASDGAVERVTPVGDYQLDLTETVPYIGATAVQDSGVDGSGVQVAVLDSGVDYTHANLGGAGTLAAYEAAHGVDCVFNGATLDCADPNYVTRDGLFPTDKVVNGYDFVGEEWPNGPLLPDSDPIDWEGHGTHVADIIAGNNGVAPGAEIVAVRVCSAVATSCSGVALIQGMEFAVDPNGDGKVKDRVDVINMSLGSLYGQPFDDDLSAAVDGATALGVLTVASAGNSADKPFVTGSPAAADTALSVAQTQVPSAKLPFITVTSADESSADFPAVFQPWSPEPTEVIIAEAAFPTDSVGLRNGCAPFDVDLTGLVVLIDRGGCNFTLKALNVQNAGGIAAIIGLVTPGAPFPGGDGGDGPITIPSYMISQNDSNTLKGSILAGTTTITLDPDNGLQLAGTVVGSSSRGPQFDDQRIKPEIGAPGASISAEAGTGTGETPFGGTSGAAPMVSGAAALVIDATGGSKSTGNGRPSGNANGFSLSPLEVKALLMNSGETQVFSDALGSTGQLDILAEISRIGGGEVRVNNALGASALAYDADEPSGALSFGYVPVADTVTITKTVTVKNLTGTKQVFDVEPSFRAPGPEASGAVTVNAPSSVTLKPGKGKTTSFDVSITIDGSLLPSNGMNSGSGGADPALLTAQEFDGYLTLNDPDDGSIHLAWHVLPRKVAEVTSDVDTLSFDAGVAFATLTNTGSEAASVDQYALMAIDPDEPEGARGEQSPVPDIRGVGIQTFPVPAGFCSGNASFVWEIAIDTWEEQTHSVAPGVYFIDVDTDGDGTPDHVIYNYDLSGLGTITDGRNVTWAAPYVDFEAGIIGGSSAFFFTDHVTITGNTILTICGEQIGLDATDFFVTPVTLQVSAVDIYFGGPGDDLDPFTIAPFAERYFAVDAGTAGALDAIEPGSSADLAVIDFGPNPGDSENLGVLIFTNRNGGATPETEAVYLLAP